MAYQKWTPTQKAKVSPSTSTVPMLMLSAGTYKGKARLKALLNVPAVKALQLDQWQAVEIYLDKEKGFIGFEGVKGAVPVKVSKIGGNIAFIFEALEGFNYHCTKNVRVPLHDVSKTKAPVQLELSIAELAKASGLEMAK